MDRPRSSNGVSASAAPFGRPGTDRWRTTVSVFACLLMLQGAAAGADVESQARALEAMLIAPCCFTQQVSVHHSPAADEVRADIRHRLQAGQTSDEILQAYVERYGTRILAEPPSEGLGRLLYTAPPIVFALSAVLLWFIVRRLTAHGLSSERPARELMNGDQTGYAAKLEDQLRDLD